MEVEAKVEIVDLTRELATELAEHIPHYQRGVRSRWVAAMAGDIDEGRWRLSDSAIVVATDDKGRGQLQNGQHRVLGRLLAKTDPPCPAILLTRTVNDIDDYLVIDAGKKRQFGDYLRLMEETGVQAKSSIIRTLLLTEIGGVAGYVASQKYDTSHAEMAQLWHNRDPEVMDEIVKRYYRLVRIVGGQGARYLATLNYIIRTQAPHLDIEGFMDAIEYGPEAENSVEPNLNAGAMLQSRLIRWTHGVTRVPRTTVARCILKAWNMWVAGERGQKLRIPKSNEGLEIIPEWAKE